MNSKLNQALMLLAECRDSRDYINIPADVFPYLTHFMNLKQEHFIVVSLDSMHHVIHVHDVAKGTVNNTMVHPREVFRPAILDNAVAIIIAHNHPAGSDRASLEDIKVTQRLRQAGKIIGITVLDHVIITRSSFTSLLEVNKSLFEEDAI